MVVNPPAGSDWVVPSCLDEGGWTGWPLGIPSGSKILCSPLSLPPHHSSATSRVPPASPSSHSIAASSSSSERTRLSRGTNIRSTFHGGQVRDRRGTGVQNGPPTSPTLSHEASPLPQSRSRATSNLFSKLTSKLTRRVTLDPSKRQNSNRCVSGASMPQGSKIRSQTNLRESGDLRSQGTFLDPVFRQHILYRIFR
uniref:Uncharacterized protein n=1 Tax=Anolis carolinensis TaxID=28377 RepID=H9GUI2_ANOCA